MEDKTAETMTWELETPEVLDKLASTDKQNLLDLSEALDQAAKEKGLEATLVLVGGILTKTKPRKDIDVLIVFEENQNLPDPNTSENYLETSRKDFRVLTDLLESEEVLNKGFAIVETIPPSIDEEFNSPSILKHNGSLTVKRNGGTPIEICPIQERGIDAMKNSTRRPFAILSTKENGG